MKLIYFVLVVVCLLMTQVAQATGVDECSTARKADARGHRAAPSGEPADIVDTAVSAGNFKTLVAAAKAAGLVEALKGPGPFTVLAPTDEAFAKIPQHTVRSLLKPENRSRLARILSYHVIPGRLEASDVAALSGAKTLEGGLLKFYAYENQVRINNARVVKADIAASNGVIHVIDTVLMPQ